MTRRLSLTFLITVVACSTGITSVDRGLETLRNEQAAWQRLAIHAYTIDFKQTCFCPQEVVDPFRIEVRADTVYGVLNLRTQAAMPLKRQFGTWSTVDSVFAQAERLYATGQYKVDVNFDATYHYPSRLYGDIPLAIDDELLITVTNFVKAP